MYAPVSAICLWYADVTASTHTPELTKSSKTIFVAVLDNEWQLAAPACPEMLLVFEECLLRLPQKRNMEEKVVAGAFV